MRVVLYISFKFDDAETRYSIGEWETLGVVKALLKCRRYVLLSPHATIIYTDYLNIILILSVKGILFGKITV